METYNYARLLGRMKEKGYTQKTMAEAVGISESSLNQKLKNKGQFWQDEIAKISTVLNIPLAECDKYFFVH